MRVRILSGYRGVRTQESYLGPGEHDLEPGLAMYLVDNGHAVALEEPPPPEPEQTADEWSFSEWTVAQLRDFASDNDINLHGATVKDDIIAAIETAIDNE